MVGEQKGLCLLCGHQETLKSFGRVKSLSVDHCHATGRNRGLLCHQCNTSLGKLGDTPDAIARALLYVCELDHRDSENVQSLRHAIERLGGSFC